MIFAAHKEHLLKALDRISPVVKANPRSIDILQSVHLETHGSQVYASATSAMASVRVLIEQAVSKEAGALVVNFDKLKDRVSKSAESVLMEVAGTTLKITSSDDQRLGIALSDLREFPEIEWGSPEESYGLASTDLVTLFKTANSVTSSVTSLNPMFLQVLIKDQSLWGANSVSYQKLPLNCNPSLVTRIPTSTLSALTKFIQDSGGEKVWISQSSHSQVVVTVGQDQFQTVPLSVDFPDLSQVFLHTDIRMVDTLTVSRNRLISELSKAKTSADAYGRVTLTIEGTALSRVHIKTQSEHGDWFETQVTGAIWDGSTERTLTFNIDSLLNFLRSFRDEEIQLEMGEDFKGDLTPLMCKEGEHVGILNQFRI